MTDHAPRLGMSVRIVAPRAACRPLPELSDKITVSWAEARVKGYDAAADRVALLRAMRGLVRELDSTVDLWHALDAHLGFAALWRNVRQPIVCTFASDPLYEWMYYGRRQAPHYDLWTKGTAVRLAWRRGLRSWLRPADAIVGLTAAETDRLRRRIGNKNTRTIPPGVDTEWVFRAPSECNLMGGAHPRILWIGRLTAWKRPFAAIEAWRLVKARLGEASLLLVGDGPLRKQVDESARQYAPDVRMYGQCDQDTLHGLYRSADFLLSTSVYETFGLAVTEAMAVGLPVIVADLDNYRDRVLPGETGWVAPSGAPEELADRIVRAWSDPSHREKVTKAAARRILDGYTATEMTDSFHRLYQGLDRSFRGSSRQGG